MVSYEESRWDTSMGGCMFSDHRPRHPGDQLSQGESQRGAETWQTENP